MTADALKSTSITNLDASPIVANSSGVGAAIIERRIADVVTPTTGGLVATTSTYKMVRVPTNIQLQHVNLYSDSALDTGGGSAALAFDIGVYYSDSTTDGTPAANQGTAVADNCIADAYAYKGSTSALAVEAGKWTAANRQLPLWQAAGLSSDPGGNFDIVITVETAANTAASAPLMLEAEFNLPG